MLDCSMIVEFDVQRLAIHMAEPVVPPCHVPDIICPETPSSAHGRPTMEVDNVFSHDEPRPHRKSTCALRPAYENRDHQRRCSTELSPHPMVSYHMLIFKTTFHNLILFCVCV